VVAALRSNKISLQAATSAPDLARQTVPGSGNFCVLTEDPVADVADALRRLGVEILAGPDEREGATGKLRSVYFRDPEGNLVEVSNRLENREREQVMRQVGKTSKVGSRFGR
jgi:catechol 2,3-dioxygenase-like lactoylglutathione lyase family enzyme